MPTVHHTGVSRKIASEEERHRLKRIALSERGEAQGGFIVRTAAAGAEEQNLRNDIRFLINLWNEIKGRADTFESAGVDLSRLESGGAHSARSGERQLFRHMGGHRAGIRTHSALREPLPAFIG